CRLRQRSRRCDQITVIRTPRGSPTVCAVVERERRRQRQEKYRDENPQLAPRTRRSHGDVARRVRSVTTTCLVTTSAASANHCTAYAMCRDGLTPKFGSQRRSYPSGSIGSRRISRDGTCLPSAFSSSSCFG